MNRRQLIGGIGATALRVAPLSLATFSRPAGAVAPLVAISIAQACIQFYQMIKGSGPGLTSLLALQTELLRNISTQLVLVQKSLTVIFEDLEKLKNLVRELPVAQVVETYNAEVSGAMRRYNEVMKTYERDRDARGIAYANGQNQLELEGVIVQIRHARDILMGYRQEMTIPILGCALQTEIHCMILSNVRDNRIVTALTSFKFWFDEWLDPNTASGLQGLLNSSLEALRVALEARESNRNKYSNFYCGEIVFRITFVRNRSVASRAQGTRESLILTPETDGDLMPLWESAREINQADGAIPDAFFKIRTEAPSFSIGQVGPLQGPAAQEAFDDLRSTSIRFMRIWPGYTGYCPTSKTSHPQIIDAKKTENESIELIRQRILAIGAFRSVAVNCSTFCNRLLSDLDHLTP